MSASYAKHNIYVGKYELSDRLHVPLASGRWRVSRAVESDDGLFLCDEGDQLVLILQDDNFWPVISFLNVQEAEALSRQLLVEATKLRVTPIGKGEGK